MKRGFRHGKQRYECKDCHHVFVYNAHTLTMYSKIDHSMFSQIILDTLNCFPQKKTVAKLNNSAQSVFENRHKFLCTLEASFDSDELKLCGFIEIDETYLLKNEKGFHNIKRKARQRGEPSNYRGISREQVCIVTTTDRNMHEIFKVVG